MKARVILTTLFVGILLGALWLDGRLEFAYASFTILVLMGTAGAVEWNRILRSGPNTYPMLLIVAAVTYPLLECYRIVKTDWPGGQSDFLFIFAFVFLLFGRAILAGHVANGLDRVARTLLGFVLLFLFYRLCTILLTRPEEGGGLASAYALVLTAKACDSGAYVAGRTFGRAKLIPKVSPGKTRAGAVGGMIFSTLIGALTLSLLGPRSLLFGLLFGVVIGAVTMVSDLAESLIKRCVQVKDSSSLLPEIGGVLDLIDSLILAAPTGYFLLIVI